MGKKKPGTPNFKSHQYVFVTTFQWIDLKFEIKREVIMN